MNLADLDELDRLSRRLRDQQRRIDLGERGNWTTTITQPITGETMELSVPPDKRDEMRAERDKRMKDLKDKIDKIDWSRWEE